MHDRSIGQFHRAMFACRCIDAECGDRQHKLRQHGNQCQGRRKRQHHPRPAQRCRRLFACDRKCLARGALQYPLHAGKRRRVRWIGSQPFAHRRFVGAAHRTGFHARSPVGRLFEGGVRWHGRCVCRTHFLSLFLNMFFWPPGRPTNFSFMLTATPCESRTALLPCAFAPCFPTYSAHARLSRNCSRYFVAD